MKVYEPVTLTHMQAYLLQFLLEKHPAQASGGLGASSALSALYRQVQGTPAPKADDLVAGIDFPDP